MNSTKRPWQGTTLAVFSIIATICLVVAGVAALAFQGMVGDFLGSPEFTTELSSATDELSAAMTESGTEVSDEELAAMGELTDAMESAGFASMVTSMMSVAGVVLLALGVLYFFISRGLLRGARWALITDLVFLVLAVLGSLSGYEMLLEGQGLISLALNVFLMVIAIQMLKSPYYKKA